MAHKRTLIRQRVVDRLTGLIPVVGTKVFRSRVLPLQSQEFPGICVHILRETVVNRNLDGGKFRTARLAIDLYGRDGTVPDDELDGYAETIEARMEADPQLGRHALKHDLVEVAFAFDAGGEQVDGLLRLLYDVEYETG